MKVSRGFVALTSVLLVSIITATYAVLGTNTAFTTIHRLQRLSKQDIVTAQAEGCLVMASAYGAKNIALPEHRVVQISESSVCHIKEVSIYGNRIDLKTSSQMEDIFVYLNVFLVIPKGTLTQD